MLFSLIAIEQEIIRIAGIIAGALVMTGFVPQVFRAYRRKSMADVSMFLMILISTGMFLWIFYGLVKEDPVIYGANIAGVSLNFLLIGMKVNYDKIGRRGRSSGVRGNNNGSC